MQKSDFEKYLKRLEDLDKQLDDDATDTDPSEFISELNTILNGLSQDISLDKSKNSLTPTLKFVNMSNNPDPVFAHEGDSGFDLRAHLVDTAAVHMAPGSYYVVPTGLYFEIDKGYEIQIRPRSGLAYSHGITIVNSPGTIDSHYRGEIKIILSNLGMESFVIKNGDRIAQGVVCPVYGEGNLNMEKVEKLSETLRNTQGFGSTGIS